MIYDGLFANLKQLEAVQHTEGYLRVIAGAENGKTKLLVSRYAYLVKEYAHHTVHPHYRPLRVGCICAGKMEGDIEKAKRRENNFKSKEARRKTS